MKQKEFEELESHWFSCSRIEYCEVCELIFQAKSALDRKMREENITDFPENLQ
jgi:hypothetical protein